MANCSSEIICFINKCRIFLWSRGLIVLVSPINRWSDCPHKNHNLSRPLLIGTFFMVDGFMWKEIIPVWNSYCQLGLTKLSKYFPIGKWSWKERKNTITQPRFNSCSLMILNNLELSFCNCSAELIIGLIKSVFIQYFKSDVRFQIDKLYRRYIAVF